MKKLLLIIAIIVTMALTLVGCASTPVPGTAWADHEVLTYDVIEDGAVIGTMTTTIEILEGEQSLTLGADKETKYNVGTGLDGKRLTQTIVIDGKIAMQSQALVKRWSTIASYKMVDYKDNNYAINSTYSGKYVKYTKTTGDAEPVTGSIKIGKSGYIDNEFIYTYIRAYAELDSSMSKSVTTIDYENMQKTTLSIATTTDNVEKFAFEGKERECAKMIVQHTSSPVGKSIQARYLTRKAYEKPSSTSPLYGSYHLPAEIVENNLTYKLKSITV